jgi:hypothetical protein
MPPFDSSCVSSYAVHPDGHTIFVSVTGYKLNPGLILPNHGDLSSTFTFDVESLEWTHVGDWILPFRGQAYYDHDPRAGRLGWAMYPQGRHRACVLLRRPTRNWVRDHASLEARRGSVL